MGTIRKIGNDYYIEFTARGLKYQRNGGTDKDSAQCLLDEIEDKIRKGEMSIAVHDVEVGRFFESFLDLIKNDSDERTYARYGSAVGHFQEFIRTALPPACQLSQMTPSVIEKYRATLVRGAVKPAVINFTIYLLRDLFDHAINFGHINDNPTLHTQLIPIPDRKDPRVLSSDDVQKLLDDSPDDARDMIEILLRTGITIEEFNGLKWANADFKNNCLKVELLPDALRRDRQIPMDSKVLSIIRRLRDQKRAQQERIFCAGEGDVISGSVQCALRNTFADNVLKKGVSLISLYKLLGFRDIARVMRYEGFVPNG